MPFKLISFIVVFFYALMMQFPSAAMEPFGQPMNWDTLLEQDNPHQGEDTPLLEQVIVDDGQEYPSPLYDGSRRFYDDEAKWKAKKKACKECVKFTALRTAGATAILGGGAGIINLIGSAIGCAIINDFDWCRDEILWGSTKYLTLPETAFAFALVLPIASIVSWKEKVSPILREKSPFESGSTKWCCLEIEFDGPSTKVSQELLDAANDTLRWVGAKDRIQEHVDTLRLPYEKFRLWKLYSRIIPSRRKKNDFIEKMTARITDAMPKRKEYHLSAYRVKELLCANLPPEIICKIFSYFPNQNILEQMLSHLPRRSWDANHSYITEKEMLTIKHLSGNELYDYPFDSLVELTPYCHALVLAANGWLSFEKSEKYPITCCMKYFDEQTLKKYQSNPAVGPTIYLPYSPELAQYYKFEDDPAYELDHVAPSNEKIRRLLTLRQDIIAQRTQNNALQQLQDDNN